MAAAGAAWTKVEIAQLLQEVKDATSHSEIAAKHGRTENAIICKIQAEIEKLHLAGVTNLAEYGFEPAAIEAAVAKAGSQRTITIRRDRVEAAGGNWAAISAAKPNDLSAALAAAYPIAAAAASAAKPRSAQAAVEPRAPASEQQSIPSIQYPIETKAEETVPLFAEQITGQVFPRNGAANSALRSKAEEQRSSSTLGALGEAEVARVLGAAFAVTATGGTARAGDLRCVREGRTIMVEVKNYVNPVPGAEVDKFARDLEARSEVQGGLFVSLRSGISCQPDTVRFTEIAARPAILLHGVDPATIGAFALVLDRIIAERATAARAARSLSARSSEAISAHLRDIAAAAGELSLSRTLLCELQDGLNRGCSKVQSAILGAEHRIATHIDALMDTIHTAAESPATIPENLSNAVREAIRGITPDAHCLSNTQCVSALGAILRKLPANTKLATSASAVILSWGQARLELAPLKTRTNLSLVPGREFVIPAWCKYDRGTISVQMDAAFITNRLDEFVSIAISH